MYKINKWINNEKKNIWKKPNLDPSGPPLPSIWGGGGSSADSPLKIWDAMTPYLKTLFDQKTENW